MFTGSMRLQEVGDSCNLSDDSRAGEDNRGDVGDLLDNREGLPDGGERLFLQPALGVGIGGKRERSVHLRLI